MKLQNQNPSYDWLGFKSELPGELPMARVMDAMRRKACAHIGAPNT